MSKIFITIILILLTILGAGGFIGYKYYQTTQSTIEQLNTNNALLKSAHEETLETLKLVEETAEKQRLLNEELQSQSQNAEQELADFKKILNEYNLGDLSTTEPGLIQERVNNALNNIFGDIESITN